MGKKYRQKVIKKAKTSPAPCSPARSTVASYYNEHRPTVDKNNIIYSLKVPELSETMYLVTYLKIIFLLFLTIFGKPEGLKIYP